jgi:hypothetical protein
VPKQEEKLWTWVEKSIWAREVILPALVKAFQNADDKMPGKRHNQSHHHTVLRADEDVRHVRECHIDVCLLQAESAAISGDIRKALRMVESAIGHAVLLHRRLYEEQEPPYEEPETTPGVLVNPARTGQWDNHGHWVWDDADDGEDDADDELCLSIGGTYFYNAVPVTVLAQLPDGTASVRYPNGGVALCHANELEEVA